MPCILPPPPRRYILISTYLMALALCLMPMIDAHSAQVTLAWDSNSEPDLAGYRVYYGEASRDYQYSVDVGKDTSCTLSGLKEGKTYYFSATAYDINGHESPFSSEVSVTIPKPDADGDGIRDEDEIETYGTDPNRADTDQDGADDGDELAWWRDAWDADEDGDGFVNLLDPDSDNDGTLDGVEISIQRRRMTDTIVRLLLM